MELITKHAVVALSSNLETFLAPDALAALHVLGQKTRLEIFRLLARREPVGFSAAAIAEMIRTPQNSVSLHLAILTRARLIAVSRRGRSIVYHAKFDGMQALILYLLVDCCNGHPGVSARISAIVENGCGCCESSKA